MDYEREETLLSVSPWIKYDTEYKLMNLCHSE